MIDAVSTLSVQNAALRAAPQAVASASEVVATASAGAGDFVTSRVFIDNLQNAAILEYRSSKTGEVIAQYPSEGQIRAFHRAEQSAEVEHTAAPHAAAPALTSPAPVPVPEVHIASTAGTSAPAPAPTGGTGTSSGAGSVVA